jgi:hypothetical protein
VPVHHEIDLAARLIVMRFSGEVTAGEIFEYYGALAADPLLRPNLAVLADCREVTSVPTFEELGLVANTNLRTSSTRPTRAAVIVSTPWLFGIARQFAVLAEPNGIHVVPFYDENDARQWISKAAPSARAADQDR